MKSAIKSTGSVKLSSVKKRSYKDRVVFALKCSFFLGCAYCVVYFPFIALVLFRNVGFAFAWIIFSMFAVLVSVLAFLVE